MAKKTYKLKSAKKPAELSIAYAKELNKEQLDVVQRGDGACLVLAGAGSGKTRTLVYRVAYLLEHGVKPEHILLMTFTNKAAREMTTRVESLLQYHPKGLWAGTFHHVGNRILRKYIAKLGYTNNYTIMDQSDTLDLIKNIIGEVKKNTDRYFPKARVVHSVISFATNSGRNIEDVMLKKYSHLDPNLIDTLEVIAGRFKKKKQQLNTLDYDDLLLLWLKLMQEFPQIQKTLAQVFQYTLVDEYQDTNYLQAQVIEHMTQHHGNILVVGDDAQSIYSFRAADVQNILSFPKLFKNTKTFKLETNYRSTPEILNLANDSITHNTEQFSKELKSVKKSGNKPIIAPAANSDEQAEFITQRILELNDEGISLNNIAVLFRADFHALELELALNKKSIPYVKRGGLRFFEQAHLKDMIAFLRIINNPQDELSWTRALLLQPGIGKVGAAKLTQVVASLPLEDTMHYGEGLTGKLQKSWKQFAAILKPIVTETTAATIMQHVLDAFYEDHLRSTYDNPEKRIEDINQLINFSDQFGTLGEMLSDLALSENYSAETVVREEEEPEEQLVISTIHQAKGLEWDTVFVMHAASGHFPHAKSLGSRSEFEEERRLFYVATTRAERELYLTYPITTYSHSEGLIFSQPSEFIQELNPKRYDQWNIESDADSQDLPIIEYLPEV